MYFMVTRVIQTHLLGFEVLRNTGALPQCYALCTIGDGKEVGSRWN